jgi:hypothetical protein
MEFPLVMVQKPLDQHSSNASSLLGLDHSNSVQVGGVISVFSKAGIPQVAIGIWLPDHNDLIVSAVPKGDEDEVLV